MGKSSHHKTENTFKFQSFSERIANVNIDVIRRIRYNDDQPEESGTYFGEGLNKWTELNCTQHFSDFRSEISPQVQTFTQLVHHEPEIVSGLQKHLQVPNSLALEPLLDLVVQLARDLQLDFYKHFERFFTVLVGLLNAHPQDSELLEKVFTCLSYLFKFLWRYLLKDIRNVYRIFSTLLGDSYKDYIQNFAAESFSFLMRKAKDPNDLLDFLLTSLKTNPEQTAGVGQLLFEMMKGVRGRFHSSLPQVFPLILGKLGQIQNEPKTRAAKLPWEQVEGAFSHMMSAMADYSEPDHLREPWNIILSELDRLHQVFAQAGKAKSLLAAQQISRLLKLINGWLVYHRGKIICDPDNIAEILLRLLKGAPVPNCGETLLQATASLLLLAHSRLSMEHTAKLISLTYKAEYESSLLNNFTRRLFNLPLFEKDVLPSLLAYCDQQMEGGEEGCRSGVITLLTELIQIKVPVPDVLVGSWSKKTYLLDFGSVKMSKKKFSVPRHILEVLTSTEVTGDVTDQSLGRLWSVLVSVPHVRPIEKKSAIQSIGIHLGNLVALLEKTSDRTDVLLTVLYQAAQTLSLLTEAGQFFDLIHLGTLNRLWGYHDNIIFLRLCDLYFDVASNEGHTSSLTAEVFRDVFSGCNKNLSSQYHEVRLLTLRIFTRFELSLPDADDRVSAPVSVFETCYQAEAVPLNVHDYKRKLMHLRNLDYHIVQNSLPEEGCQQVPLQFLIGSLFNNFKLLWEPLCNLIASHANGLDRKAFWEIYTEQLNKASELAEKSSGPNSTQCDTGLAEVDSGLATIFKSQCGKLGRSLSKPDYSNFRCHLWKAMYEFSSRAEAKSRDIVTLFMTFLLREYYPVDLNAAPTQDVTSQQGEITNSEDDDESEKPKKGGGKKKAIKSLVVFLGLFAKFSNPRSVFQEPKLSHLYYQLLQHQDEDLQKGAFYCLLTYKWKYLMPYKENFERLLDEETFRGELVMFSLDTETSPISREHRTELLPLLFRLLYGKMKGKTGSNSAGKGNSNLRRSVVFRFLAGCQQHELKVFLDLVFEPSKSFVTDNIGQKLMEIRENLDFSQMIPLKKIQGIVNTIDVLCKKLGHLLRGYLPSLLQILLGLTQVCVKALDSREVIRPGAVNMLKLLRQLTISQINQFFHEFEDYSFTQDEIDGIFTVAVWPQLERLPQEGVYHPTPLLKLLHTWSKHPRYVPLLGKCQPDTESQTPLPHVYKLLLTKSAHHTVTSVIIDTTDNLLSLPDHEPTTDSQEIPVEPTKLGLSQTDDSEAWTVGTRLLVPHIPALLEHIEGAVKQLAVEQNKKSSQIPELHILSRVSSFVTDESQCMSLIQLLLPFLSSKSSAKSQDKEADILQSILNLMKPVTEPSRFYRPVSKLFSSIEARPSRQILCEIMQVIGKKIPRYSQVAELITQLNSWDRRRMEEPDYTLRLGAFQTINTSVREMTQIDADFLFPVLHNSCYFIATVDDLSLRDNATHCMVTMVKQVAAVGTETDVFRDLITQGLLPEVKASMRHKKELVRHEFVSILAVMVSAFPSHACFLDLVPLTDKDVEADFFENIRHIQTHRRARALRRLIKHLQGHAMRVDAVQSYLLPLTSAFLLDESYLKYNSLQDAAVDAVGALCRCLPWRQYCVQLRFYLGQLPKKISIQKLLVRIIVVVLDAFHFDLSNSTFQVSKAPRAVKEEGEKDDVTDDAELQTEDEPKDVQTDDQTDALSEVTPFNPQEKILCSAELATKIHSLILKTILPQLHKSLTQKVRSEGEHKLARSNYAEDDEVLRVPIALAMVKLLQNLPKGSLHQNLPSILMKVCHFLKSRSKDVRQVSRDTLVKMAASLGIQYFPYILTEMRSTLKRGYQLHVLSYTVHTILRSLSDQVNTGDLDGCLQSLLEVCNEEVFGQVAEEKDVQGIVGKLMEAKSSKSYDSYELISGLVGQGSLTMLIRPLKEILDSTKSQKTSKKAEDLLRRVCKGLLDNKGLTEENLLVFVHGLTSQSLPVLNTHNKETKQEKEEVKPGQRPPSCLLLTTAAPRGGAKPKNSTKTNAHVLVEFGLQLLHLLLKKSRVVSTDLTHLQMCSPFIPVLSDCLSAKHVKLTSVSLRCLCWLLRFPLPSLETHVEKMASAMFVLLKNYASAGAAKGDNEELITMCFKAVTVLVRDVTVFTLSTDQLRVLISFCEEDIHDYNRQGTAFTLLKAILSRKLVLPEIHELMGKVEKMALTAESAHVRLQSRQLTLHYLMDYPLGSRLQKHLQFFVKQLGYELESGRESALEMLATIFSSFPQAVLVEYSGLLFFPMATSLANDESPKCKKLTALALKSLLEKVDLKTRNDLFDLSMKWFGDEKISLRTLGAQLCGLFVEVESARFEHRLENILPVLSKQIHPDRYTQVSESESLDQENDRLLFNCLTCLIKILRECDVVRNMHWTKHMAQIWAHVESHLGYPHLWVQFSASQLFGLLFAAWTPGDLITAATTSTSPSDDYILSDTLTKLSRLASAFCAQLQSPLLDQDLAEQVVKNMVFILKAAKSITGFVADEKVSDKDAVETSSKGDNTSGLSVRWLVKKMVREANHETINQPKVTIKRRNVFKWMAATGLDLGKTMLPAVLPLMLPPLIRESSEKTNSTDATLKTLAGEVLEVVKGVVGVEKFTELYSRAHSMLLERRTNRKRLRAEEAVSNPEVAAKRKLKKNLHKKEARKRRIEEIRPAKRVKKKKIH